MSNSKEKHFVPLFIFPSAVLAVTAPYLSIMLRDLGYSQVWVGILLGIINGAGIAGPILLGYLADKTGNYRPVLTIACLLPAVVVFPILRWVHPIITAILLSMMLFGLRSLTSLVDAITTIQIGRTGNYGKIRVWGSISFIVVTLFLQLTPVLKPYTATNIGIWIIITALISFIPVLLLPAASLRSPVEHGDVVSHNEEPVKKIGRGKIFPVISPYIMGGFAVIFMCSFSMSSVYTYFPLYMVESLRWDAVGLMFAIATTSEVPIMFLSGALIRRFGSMPLLALAAAGIGLRLLIWAVLPFKPWIIASQLLHSLCFGIFHPAAIHFIAGIFPAKKRGVGMSMYMALGSGLPSLIGNMAGGAIAAAAGYRALFAIYAAVAGAAVIICGAMRLKGNTNA